VKADLVPGMAPGSSYFPRNCQIGQNMSYDKVVQLIIEGGISRVPLDLPNASVLPQRSKPRKSKFKFRELSGKIDPRPTPTNQVSNLAQILPSASKIIGINYSRSQISLRIFEILRYSRSLV
jgi:hypothetical protein